MCVCVISGLDSAMGSSFLEHCNTVARQSYFHVTVEQGSMFCTTIANTKALADLCLLF